MFGQRPILAQHGAEIHPRKFIYSFFSSLESVLVIQSVKQKQLSCDLGDQLHTPNNREELRQSANYPSDGESLRATYTSEAMRM